MPKKSVPVSKIKPLTIAQLKAQVAKARLELDRVREEVETAAAVYLAHLLAMDSRSPAILAEMSRVLDVVERL